MLIEQVVGEVRSPWQPSSLAKAPFPLSFILTSRAKTPLTLPFFHIPCKAITVAVHLVNVLEETGENESPPQACGATRVGGRSMSPCQLPRHTPHAPSLNPPARDDAPPRPGLASQYPLPSRASVAAAPIRYHFLRSSMVPELDCRRLRSQESRDNVDYFRQLMADHPPIDISYSLLDALDRGSLWPSIVSIWLGVAASPPSTIFFIAQVCSQKARTAAIRRLGRDLAKAESSEILDTFGGLQTFLDLFARLPVHAVKQLSAVLGTPKSSKAVKPYNWIDELFQTLVEGGGDRRPLINVVIRMLPLCSSPVILRWLHVWRQAGLAEDRLISAHPEYFQQQASKAMFETKEPCLSNISRRLFLDLPRTRPASSDLSTPRLFALQTLRRLASGKYLGSSLDAEFIAKSVAGPLAEYLYHPSRRDMARLSDFFQLVGTAVTTKPAEWSRLFDECNFATILVRCWVRKPALFENSLRIIARAAEGEIKRHGGSMWLFKYKFVPPHLCLELLAVFASSIEVDLHSPESLATHPRVWSKEIFSWLPRQDTFDLITRLLAVRKSIQLCKNFGGVLVLTPPDREERILLRLRRGFPGVLEQAVESVQTAQKRAQSLRDQFRRCESAVLAVHLAAASGCQQLFHDVARWTKRFVKDPLTVEKLFGMVRKNTIQDLLCGLSLTSQRDFDWQEKLASEIALGNEIVRTFFSFLYAAVREPSFRAKDWIWIERLPRDIVGLRFSRTDAMIQRGHLSEKDAERIVLQPSIALVVETEAELLQPKLAQLSHVSAWGQRGYPLSPTKAMKLGRCVLEQLGKLMEARDKLWRSYRQREHPATIELSDAWSKGLPIQGLLNLFLDEDTDLNKGEAIPYLSSRAEAIVFMSGELALSDIPTAPDQKAAIGDLYDSWGYALAVYVNQHATLSGRREAAVRSWHHATTALTGGRLTDAEARGTWVSLFRQWLPELRQRLDEVIGRPLPHLQVPEQTQPGERIEWDPQADFGTSEPSRALTDTRAVDCMAFARGNISERAVVINTTPQEPWQLFADRFGKSTRGREAQFTASLLSFDAMWKTNLLLSPFPCLEDARIPAMYLDDAFLSCRSARNYLRGIEMNLAQVPPRLLEQLTSGLLNRLMSLSAEDLTLAAAEADTFNLLSLLCTCDHAALSLPLITVAILQRPESSSWHRHLLNTGLLESLSATQCEDFLISLTGSVCERLNDVHQRRQTAGSTDDHPPIVKVTTVKALAQLLQDTRFVRASKSAELLSTLFQTGTHTDIRIAAVSSLMKVLERCEDGGQDSTAEKILRFLHTDVVPVAGDIGDERLITEQDWQQAASNDVLPSVSSEASALAKELMLEPDRIGPAVRPVVYAQRVLIPLLQAANSCNRRWVELFLRKNNLSHLVGEELHFANYESIAAWLLSKYLDCLPRSLLTSYHQRVMFVIERPNEIRELNKVLKYARDGQDSSARYWLKNFDIFPSSLVVDLLRDEIKPSQVSAGIDLSSLQDLVLTEAELYLGCFGSGAAWDDFMDALRPKFSERQEAQMTIWLKQAKPVLRQIIKTIERLKTPQWQENPQRKPKYLPDTFELRLMLLTHPALRLEMPKEQQLSAYCGEVLEILEKLVADSPRLPYHRRLETLKQFVKTGMTDSQLCLVAYRFGDIANVESWSLLNHLSAEIASTLVKQIQSPGDLSAEDAELLTSMMRTWVECSIEDVRNQAWALLKKPALRDLVKLS